MEKRHREQIWPSAVRRRPTLAIFLLPLCICCLFANLLGRFSTGRHKGGGVMGMEILVLEEEDEQPNTSRNDETRVRREATSRWWWSCSGTLTPRASVKNRSGYNALYVVAREGHHGEFDPDLFAVNCMSLW
ncbi:uncharacterized protein LOC125523920 isoform X1 [Triticum urartu]|uniref:uncharacterized protein LOC125523920 isoform X1 n=1 Tax=Triticum urartu TaxID=4572 RepID=UPI0020439757|nr:uncharacterized protein LOC125523920 isoform X1 [Triticum urartu]